MLLAGNGDGDCGCCLGQLACHRLRGNLLAPRDPRIVQKLKLRDVSHNVRPVARQQGLRHYCESNCTSAYMRCATKRENADRVHRPHVYNWGQHAPLLFSSLRKTKWLGGVVTGDRVAKNDNSLQARQLGERGRQHRQVGDAVVPIEYIVLFYCRVIDSIVRCGSFR